MLSKTVSVHSKGLLRFPFSAAVGLIALGKDLGLQCVRGFLNLSQKALSEVLFEPRLPSDRIAP
jgi:hypothetical protein